MRPLVSVVVPVYNTSRYLRKCIDSILNQGYEKLEIVIVNDASTDGSLLLLEELYKREKKIVIINKIVNEGVEKARYDGLQICKGDYVMYVDSDDWIRPGIIHKMVEKAVEENVDLVMCAFERVIGSGIFVNKKSVDGVSGLIRNPKLFDEYYLSFFGCNILNVSVCGKLYKKNILRDNYKKMLGISFGEDMYVNLSIFPYLDSIFVMEECGYCYRYGGMTSRYNEHLQSDYLKLFYERIMFIKKYDYWKAYPYLLIEMKNVLYSDISQMVRKSVCERKELIVRIENFLKESCFDLVIDYYINKNNKDAFVNALVTRDAENLYAIVERAMKKTHFVRKQKKMAIDLLMRF